MVPSAGTRKRAEDPDLRFSVHDDLGCVSDTERIRRIGHPAQYDTGWLTVADADDLSLGPGLGRHGGPDGADHTAPRCLPRRVLLLRDTRTSEMPVGHFFHFQVVVDVGDFRMLADPGDDVFCRALPARWHP
jgi:hypothetical protein